MNESSGASQRPALPDHGPAQAGPLAGTARQEPGVERKTGVPPAAPRISHASVRATASRTEAEQAASLAERLPRPARSPRKRRTELDQTPPGIDARKAKCVASSQPAAGTATWDDEPQPPHTPSCAGHPHPGWHTPLGPQQALKKLALLDAFARGERMAQLEALAKLAQACRLGLVAPVDEAWEHVVDGIDLRADPPAIARAVLLPVVDLADEMPLESLMQICQRIGWKAMMRKAPDPDDKRTARFPHEGYATLDDRAALVEIVLRAAHLQPLAAAAIAWALADGFRHAHELPGLCTHELAQRVRTMGSTRQDAQAKPAPLDAGPDQRLPAVLTGIHGTGDLAALLDPGQFGDEDSLQLLKAAWRTRLAVRLPPVEAARQPPGGCAAIVPLVHRLTRRETPLAGQALTQLMLVHHDLPAGMVALARQAITRQIQGWLDRHAASHPELVALAHTPPGMGGDNKAQARAPAGPLHAFATLAEPLLALYHYRLRRTSFLIELESGAPPQPPQAFEVQRRHARAQAHRRQLLALLDQERTALRASALPARFLQQALEVLDLITPSIERALAAPAPTVTTPLVPATHQTTAGPAIETKSGLALVKAVPAGAAPPPDSKAIDSALSRMIDALARVTYAISTAQEGEEGDEGQETLAAPLLAQGLQAWFDAGRSLPLEWLKPHFMLLVSSLRMQRLAQPDPQDADDDPEEVEVWIHAERLASLARCAVQAGLDDATWRTMGRACILQSSARWDLAWFEAWGRAARIHARHALSAVLGGLLESDGVLQRTPQVAEAFLDETASGLPSGGMDVPALPCRTGRQLALAFAHTTRPKALLEQWLPRLVAPSGSDSTRWMGHLTPAQRIDFLEGLRNGLQEAAPELLPDAMLRTVLERLAASPPKWPASHWGGATVAGVLARQAVKADGPTSPAALLSLQELLRWAGSSPSGRMAGAMVEGWILGSGPDRLDEDAQVALFTRLLRAAPPRAHPQWMGLLALGAFRALSEPGWQPRLLARLLTIASTLGLPHDVATTVQVAMACHPSLQPLGVLLRGPASDDGTDHGGWTDLLKRARQSGELPALLARATDGVGPVQQAQWLERLLAVVGSDESRQDIGQLVLGAHLPATVGGRLALALLARQPGFHPMQEFCLVGSLLAEAVRIHAMPLTGARTEGKAGVARTEAPRGELEEALQCVARLLELTQVSLDMIDMSRISSGVRVSYPGSHHDIEPAQDLAVMLRRLFMELPALPAPLVRALEARIAGMEALLARMAG